MYIAMNQANATLAKPEVRQAIKWAINYDAIAKNITPMTWTVQQSFLPRGLPGALSEQPFTQDFGKAKTLLAQAGLADGFNVTMDFISAAAVPTRSRRRCRPIWGRSASRCSFCPASRSR